MEIESTGFRTDLMLLQWSGSQVIDRDDHLVIRTPANPGYWWGNFLLLARPLRVGSAQRWRQVFAKEFADADHFALGIDGTNGIAGDQATINELGLTIGVDDVLVADALTEPNEVEAEIRPLSTGQDWEQMFTHRLTVDGLRQTASHQRFLRQRVIADRQLSQNGHGLWFGAFVESQLVSTAGVFGDGHGLARYQLVMTDPAFRRRGLGSAVVCAAGQWALAQWDTVKLVIVADPSDSAVRVYRALGFARSEVQIGLERN